MPLAVKDRRFCQAPQLLVLAARLNWASFGKILTAEQSMEGYDLYEIADEGRGKV